MKESDLYLPLKKFLEHRKYEVKAEIENCDVVAIKSAGAAAAEYPPTIIELKLSLNLEVILQAVDRLLLSPTVYIGVPNSCSALKRKKKKRSIKLLKMLGLGLIAIDTRHNSAEIIVNPTSYKPRKSKLRQEWLLNEFASRTGDPNLGGAASKTGRITAYRQKAIEVANYLNVHGASKASVIARALEIPKARNILYDNYYGWFEGLGKGIYQLSAMGSQSLKTS